MLVRQQPGIVAYLNVKALIAAAYVPVDGRPPLSERPVNNVAARPKAEYRRVSGGDRIRHQHGESCLYRRRRHLHGRSHLPTAVTPAEGLRRPELRLPAIRLWAEPIGTALGVAGIHAMPLRC